MDFVIDFPISNGYSVIFMVVNYFSKAIHLGILIAKFTTYNMVCKLHGLPKSIVYDCDSVCVTNVVQIYSNSAEHYFESNCCITLKLKVTNGTIEQYLCALAQARPSNWFSFLPWAEYHYNIYYHTIAGLTPFQVMFGKPLPSIPSYTFGSSSTNACDLLLADRKAILKLLR